MYDPFVDTPDDFVVQECFQINFQTALSHLVLDVRRVDRYFARWRGAPPLLDIAADNLIDIAADNLIGGEFEVDLLDKRKLSLWWLLAGRRVKLLLVYCWCALASPQTVIRYAYMYGKSFIPTGFMVAADLRSHPHVVTSARPALHGGGLRHSLIRHTGEEVPETLVRQIPLQHVGYGRRL